VSEGSVKWSEVSERSVEASEESAMGITVVTRHTASIQACKLLANISRLRCVAIAMQPVPQLQIHPIVHN